MTDVRRLTAGQVADFERDGYVFVPGMFNSKQMSHITTWVEEVAGGPDEPGGAMFYYEDSLIDPSSRVLSRIENFVPYHRRLRELVDRLGASVADLLGEPALLFKDKINFKMPGGHGFTPHQDVQAGWDRYANLHITALLSVDDSTVENGCLELVAGFHDKGRIGDSWSPLNDDQMADMSFVKCPTRPGDVVFFDSFAPHQSGPNHTDKPRRVLYVTYNAVSQGDHRAQYYADKRLSYPPDCEREPGKKYVFRV
jgi:hypothetical protein